jgi:DNA-binding IclR family transcriptional regulator
LVDLTVREREKSGLRTVERALSVLESFTAEETECSLADLARKLRLSKATVSRLLSTLLKHGYIDRTPDGSKYCLGVKLFYLGSIVAKTMKLREVALPIMYELRDATEETVHLNIVDGNQRLCIECVEGRHELKVTTHVGQRSPLHAGASAKVLLAYQDTETIEKILSRSRLSRITSTTITEPEKLRKELEEIRNRGYAVSRGERIHGVVALSAPVRDRTGSVVASLSVLVPETRAEASRIEDVLLPLLLAKAAELSFRLGYSRELGTHPLGNKRCSSGSSASGDLGGA